MKPSAIRTDQLALVPSTVKEVRARYEGMSAEEKAHVSPEWLAKLYGDGEADPWSLGFTMIQARTGEVVGTCGFTGPPTGDGEVEVAYSVGREHEGNGYATEATRALVEFAFGCEAVRAVIAHTLAEENASGRVLTKCGFRCLGEIVHPEEGRVRKWIRARDFSAIQA